MAMGGVVVVGFIAALWVPFLFLSGMPALLAAQRLGERRGVNWALVPLGDIFVLAEASKLGKREALCWLLGGVGLAVAGQSLQAAGRAGDDTLYYVGVVLWFMGAVMPWAMLIALWSFVAEMSGQNPALARVMLVPIAGSIMIWVIALRIPQHSHPAIGRGFNDTVDYSGVVGWRG